MSKFFHDTETVPDMTPGVRESYLAAAIADFKAPSSMTREQAAADLGIIDPNEIKATPKEAMIARWVGRFREEKSAEAGDAEWRKGSFDAAHGQVCCIAVAVDDGEINSYTGSEREILEGFFCHLADSFDVRRRPLFIGHNNAAFDLPFIFRRAVILGVQPPLWMPTVPRPWDTSVFDTMYQWAGNGGRISQDNLCKALGIPGKDGMDGSMVCDAYLAGRIDDIATYCRGDVDKVRQIYKRMTFCQAQQEAPLEQFDDVAPWLAQEAA